jgi:hypothetical protein
MRLHLGPSGGWAGHEVHAQSLCFVDFTLPHTTHEHQRSPERRCERPENNWAILSRIAWPRDGRPRAHLFQYVYVSVGGLHSAAPMKASPKMAPP